MWSRISVLIKIFSFLERAPGILRFNLNGITNVKSECPSRSVYEANHVHACFIAFPIAATATTLQFYYILLVAISPSLLTIFFLEKKFRHSIVASAAIVSFRSGWGQRLVSAATLSTSDDSPGVQSDWEPNGNPTRDSGQDDDVIWTRNVAARHIKRVLAGRMLVVIWSIVFSSFNQKRMIQGRGNPRICLFQKSSRCQLAETRVRRLPPGLLFQDDDPRIYMFLFHKTTAKNHAFYNPQILPLSDSGLYFVRGLNVKKRPCFVPPSSGMIAWNLMHKITLLRNKYKVKQGNDFKKP
jgi:hypothetical protein